MKKFRLIILLVVLLVSSLSQASSVSMKVGESYSCIVLTITATRDYNWSVTGGSCISIISGGGSGNAYLTFIAVSPGTVHISCTGTTPGTFPIFHNDSWDITIFGDSPTSMTISGPASMVTDETGQMTATFGPAYQTSTVTWTSSDNEVATVNSSTGVVTAVDAGTVTIHGTSANGLTDEWPITVGLAPLTLTASLNAGYVEKGDLVALTASNPAAAIYYTLDGTEPTTASTLYTEPVAIEQTVTLWAKAFKKGYETPAFKGEYKVTPARAITRFPVGDELYIYADVNPYVEYESEVSKGPQFSTARVVCDNAGTVEGSFILNGRFLVFVPTKPLPLGHAYQVVLDEGVVVAANGYPNKPTQWNFVTGNFIRSISAGYQQAAAVRTDNTLLYWGRKINGFVDGDLSDEEIQTEPYALATNVSTASCGFTHNLLINSDGEVAGWGLQFCGELGDATSSLMTTPTSNGLASATQVVTGGQASSFVSDGKLLLAGRNDFGQVGDMELVAHSTPVDCSISNAVSAVPGWQTTLAVDNGQTLYAWGDNSNGLVGNGVLKDSYSPQKVMDDVAAYDVSRFSNSNAAAVTSDGTLYVWGLNDYGQLGDDTGGLSRTPVSVMTQVDTVAVGSATIAAIKKDGSLWMWGDNRCGQLGNGATISSAVPVKVMEDVTAVSLGDKFAVALKVDGSVWTWGQNVMGQLGDGTQQNYRSVPQMIISGRNHTNLQGVQTVNADLSVMVGEQAVANALPIPLSADYHSWTWTSNNPDIATVNSRGVVNGVKEGVATITITVDNTYTSQCTVKVLKDTVSKGDANGDGKMDINDAICIVNYLTGNPVAGFNAAAADVNGDGQVTIADAVIVVNIIMNP